VFGDPVVATGILDRFLHHSQVVTNRGDSCRLREKRRAGLVGAAPVGQDKGGYRNPGSSSSRRKGPAPDVA
jgi:hypothetical protein